MAIEDDFSVAVNGDIRHDSGSTNYTVLQLHRYLQDLADDAQASGNDLVDITSETPSDRSTDNIITLLDHSATSGPTYNIDDDAAEYLFDGSVTQDSGATVYSGLQVLGSVNNTSSQVMVIQDNDRYQFTTTDTAPYWGDQSGGGYNGNATSGILMQLMLKTRVNGADIDGQRVRVQIRHWGDTYDFFNVSMGQGVSVAAVSSTPDAQNTTTQGTVTAYADVLNSGGTANAPTGGYQTIDLNNGAGAQPYYSQWTFGGQGDGLKALWEYTKDLSGNGTTKTIDGLDGEFFLGVTHEYDYNTEVGGPFTERETLVWGTKFFYDSLANGPFTPGNYVTIGALGAAGRVLFDDGTDELIVALEDTSITLVDVDVVTEFPGPGAGATTTTAAVDTGGGATLNNSDSGGTGILLADDGTDTMWIQLLNGSAPVTTLPIRGITSSATAAVNGAPTGRTIPKIYTGSYTGNYIGAFGVGIESADLTSSDSIQDLLNVTQNPPNNVTFTVSGLVSSEDRVLVGPRLAGVLDKGQMITDTALSSGTTTEISIASPGIPQDAPTSGNLTIRVELDTGVYREQTYTSFTTTDFVIPSSDYSGGNVSALGKDVFFAYIDELAGASTASYTAIYSTDRDLQVRVRDGGVTPIKTFELPATFGSSNTTVAAIRTTDL
jgi:hypothetical protein